jgi:hypothetical protein
MAIDNSPRERQAAQLARRKASKASYDRILIVTQGTETEPLYFEEIRKKYKLQTANISVQSQAVTCLQLVEHAEQLFLNECRHKKIIPQAFEKIFVVFDKDDDATYANALSKAANLDKKLKNDLKQTVGFFAFPSVPCFELWFLLHFHHITAPMHRRDIYRLLKGYLPEYEKNATGMFERTMANLNLATQRGELLKTNGNIHNGVDTVTLVHELVNLLVAMKKQP